jgi:hypothetical protein
MSRVLQHFDGDIRKVEKAGHFVGRLRLETQDTLPTLPAELERNLTRKCFSAAYSYWFDAKH